MHTRIPQHAETMPGNPAYGQATLRVWVDKAAAGEWHVRVMDNADRSKVYLDTTLYRSRPLTHSAVALMAALAADEGRKLTPDDMF